MAGLDDRVNRSMNIQGARATQRAQAQGRAYSRAANLGRRRGALVDRRGDMLQQLHQGVQRRYDREMEVYQSVVGQIRSLAAQMAMQRRALAEKMRQRQVLGARLVREARAVRATGAMARRAHAAAQRLMGIGGVYGNAATRATAESTRAMSTLTPQFLRAAAARRRR